MGSGAGSMSTLSIMRAAILAGSPGARPFAGSSIFRKPCAGVSSFGQGCLHPLKLHRITLPPSRSTAVTGRRQGLFLARVDSRDGLRGKIIWIAATLDLAEAVWWGRSAGSVAVKSRREFASDLKAEGPARAVGASWASLHLDRWLDGSLSWPSSTKRSNGRGRLGAGRRDLRRGRHRQVAPGLGRVAIVQSERFSHPGERRGATPKRPLLRRCSTVRLLPRCGTCWCAGPGASRSLSGPSSCG
jgi:hypothetical protein